MEIIKVLAFVGFGLAIGQIWVYFALREFWKEHGGSDK